MSGPIRYVASGGQWRALSGAALNETRASAPGIVSATYDPNTELLTVQVTPPLSNGGSAITSYTAYATPQGGGVTQYASSNGTTITINNVIMGVTYGVSALANNSVGAGTMSGAVMVAIPMKTYEKPLTYNTGIAQGLPGDTRPIAPALTVVDGDAFELIIQAHSGPATVENYEVTHGFSLRRNDITFRNCRFTAPPGTTSQAGFPMITSGGSPTASRVTFIDCEFAGNGVNQNDPLGDLTLGWACSEPCNLSTQTHIRSDIWGFADGFREVTNGRYESCYIHDLTFYYQPVDSSHNDGFQFVGEADNMMIIGCNFALADTFGLSAIWQFNGAVAPGGYRTRISIVANWWEGGGYYVISGAPNLANEEMTMVMAYNRFSLQSGMEQIWYPDNNWFTAMQQGDLTLINNVWDGTGTTTGGLQVTEGSLIPVPEFY